MRNPLVKNRAAQSESSQDNGFPGPFIDIHCHCLPGLDDGPATMDEAIGLCRMLVNDGVATVIATPHVLGRYENHNGVKTIRRALFLLNERLKTENIPLTVLPGSEIRVDERIPGLLNDQQLLTLADGKRYLLLEIPYESFVNIEPLIEQLAPCQITVLVAHPERHHFVCQHPQVVHPWLHAGVGLQITAGSLLGDYGLAAREAAWHFLTLKAPIVVASDAHDQSMRRSRMTAAFSCIAEKLSEAIARRVCLDNPMHVLKGEKLELNGGIIEQEIKL